MALKNSIWYLDCLLSTYNEMDMLWKSIIKHFGIPKGIYVAFRNYENDITYLQLHEKKALRDFLAILSN